MVFSQLVGGIEIEERRPRYWNEPRRKRLSFVQSRTYRPNEWALVSSTNHRETEVDLWDRRQFEANQRFLTQEQRRLDQEDFRIRQQIARQNLERERRELLHPPPLPSMREPQHDNRIQMLPPAPPHHGGHHDRDDRRPHHGHHDFDEDPIVAVYSSDDDDSDDDRSRSPRMIDIAPRKSKLHKHLKRSRSKSRGRKPKRKTYRPASLFSSDDSDSEDDFAQGFRLGRSMSRSPITGRRGRSRSRMFELSDDSFEDLEPRLRARSGSRGPKLHIWRR